MAVKTPKKKVDAIPVLLPKHRGNVSAVARALGVTRNHLYNLINANPDFKQALQDERERMLDNAEDRLGMAIDNGEAWAVCFTLKTQGKERGYSERHEITGKDGNPIETKIVVEFVGETTE